MTPRSPFPHPSPAARLRRRALCAGAACAMLACAAPAMAQRAGSEVRNIASAELLVEGAPARIASNAATLRVAERLDIGLAATGSGVTIDGAGSAVPFTLVNGGNGNERFILAGTLQGVAGQVRGFALDSNANGIFDAGDTLLDGPTPILSPGQALALLAVVDPGMVSNGAALEVFARAATGSGAPGTRYPGRGDQGTDAIVGPTNAEATMRFTLLPGGTAPAASLEKSQSILAPDGSGMTVRGSVITYSLVARFAGSSTAWGVQIADPIPSGTSYVRGSLTLDGVALTDGADADSGSFAAGRIAVTLGDIPGAATRTVQFKVKIL
ncbi:DUF11 domain-containing protein [Sphingomonas sp. LM7]|uniref:DUF11 domain-containing protein n=1 Tax=Sphingomonas sp. LM7 TaxID=1938607 RepID=UPI000983F025|nr:DUF11 domain-containing protein [Sphingomonas sp. LM7]AQR72878.1 hypothetical protein BXU08_03580 [Sphingomonas sp. LM7]